MKSFVEQVPCIHRRYRDEENDKIQIAFYSKKQQQQKSTLIGIKFEYMVVYN